jgi:hypothetical protein
MRYNREHPDATYAPQAPNAEDMSPSEYRAFSRRAGRAALIAIDELEQRGKINLNRLTPDDVKLISNAFTNARKAARKE